MYESFQSNDHMEVIERYIVNTQIFAKRFREIAGRSLIIPKRIGADEVSPQQFQQRADALLQRHRSIEDSLLIREAKSEIMFGDIDIKSLNQFLEASKESEAYSSLESSSSVTTWYEFVHEYIRGLTVNEDSSIPGKDIDPEIMKRLLGNRSLATELTDEQLNDYYSNKVPKPTNASELLSLMSKGGGLDRKWENPLQSKTGGYRP